MPRIVNGRERVGRGALERKYAVCFSLAQPMSCRLQAAFDTGENCLSKFLLMIGVLSSCSSVGLEIKAVSTKMEGMPCPFKHREARLFDFAPCGAD